MATKNLLQAHEAMAALLQSKIGNMPEWKAFRAVDSALIDDLLETGISTANAAAPTPEEWAKMSPLERAIGGPALAKSTNRLSHLIAPPERKMGYGDLAAQALDLQKEPIPTPSMIDYIAKFRDIGDPVRAKINITSGLSHDDRFKSVVWKGGRAWWWADRPFPKGGSAGLF